MSEIKRSILFGKLAPVAYGAVESAASFCKLRGNPHIELIHWLNQVIQLPDSDVHRIARAFEFDLSILASDLTRALDRLPRGATSISDISPHLEEAVERGWVYASLLFSSSRVRTGHMMVGILKTSGLASLLLGISREFSKIRLDRLTEEFATITNGSPEEAGAELMAQTQDGPPAPAALGKQEALAKYSTNLTEKAANGEIDPVLGRDEEIRQIIDILMRRRQNNPILTGEAGVGKTAVVEGFALKIASGDVPPAMKNVILRSLDLGLLQAGAGVKGEFENRLKQVVEEVQSSPTPIILFIDEAHTLIGAGGSAGQGDAANLLKPALARGTFRTIAATTWAEYKKYIEKDPALTRRFQVIKVEEPTEETAVVMIRSLVPILQKHHRVEVLDEALRAAARLSHRYIPARQLPDKAVSLIDTACARVAVGLHTIPAEIEDARRRQENLEAERAILMEESKIGMVHTKRLGTLEQSLEELEAQRIDLEQRWGAEKDLVEGILAARTELREPAQEADSPAENRETLIEDLRRMEDELDQLQGDSPLLHATVDEQAVAAVVADWTGIPVGRMVKDEIGAVLNLVPSIERRVVGQRHALEAIAERLLSSRAGLVNPEKPIGVFMLAGPSGVGKTETALSLAEALYGGESNMITINMSEFQEAHTVSTLKGAPPGYVGYGEGGVLTEAVRRRPYSIVLLDEVEKAHSDVHEIFFQVFDKGMMEDGEGRLIDFKNTIILLTTNVGSDLILGMCKDPELSPDPEGIAKALRPQLLKAFPAALLGRLNVIPYYPLSDLVMRQIIRLQLNRIVKRLQDTHEVELTYDDAVVDLVAGRCTEVESGGRMVDAILNKNLLPEISGQILRRMFEGSPVTSVQVAADSKGFSFAFQP